MHYKSHIAVTCLLLLPFLLVLLGCSHKIQDDYVDRLDSLANSDPEAALREINKFSKGAGEYMARDRMRIELVKYKAEDKCYIVHNVDTTIRTLTNYFQHHGSTYERLLCSYYMGSTYRDMKKYPLSVIWYEKTIELAESEELSARDSFVLALAHSQIADVFYKIGDKHEALHQEVLSYNIQHKIGTANFVTMEDLGRFYENVGQVDSAAKFYHKALMGILNQGKAPEYVDYLGEQLYFYTSNNKMQNAELLFDIIKHHKIPDAASNVYTAIAYYYSKKNLPDSTLKYMTHALNLEKRFIVKANLSRSLARIWADKRNSNLANKYAMRSLALYDSADIETNASGVVNARNQMILTQLQKAKAQKKDTERQNIIYLSFLIIALLLLVAIIFIFLFIGSKRKLKYQADLQRISIEKDKLSADHISLKNRMIADRQLRLESALDVSTIIKHLQDLSDDPRLKLQPDYWDAIFNVVDKLHPNFRDRLLSYCQELENKDLILLYLMKLGFSQADVSRIINRNPSVISRKLKKIEKLLGVSVKEALTGAIQKDEEASQKVLLSKGQF